MGISAVYAIINTLSGKRYIGSAKDISVRWSLHLSQLQRGCHHSLLLQRAWRKYGSAAFRFQVLEECSHEELITKEQGWLDEWRSYLPQFGYNVSPNAASSLGIKRTQETRMRQSASRMGKPPWNKGKTWSAAVREKLRAANLGKCYPPEVNTKKGWPRGQSRALRTVEHRVHLSIALRGKPKAPRTPEHSQHQLAARRRNGTMSQNGWYLGRLTSEQAAARGRKIWAARRANGTVATNVI